MLDEGLGMGIRRDPVGFIGQEIERPNYELKRKLNIALRSMKRDGSLNSLILKWVLTDAAPFE